MKSRADWIRLGLVILWVFVLIILDNINSGHAQTDTPTPSKTPRPTATLPYYVITEATLPSDFSCPPGTPAGWMTVTPNPYWVMQCEGCSFNYSTSTSYPTKTIIPTPSPNCMQGARPSATSTFLPGTPTIGPGTPTQWCEDFYTKTPTPTITKTPTLTPTPTKTSTPSGWVYFSGSSITNKDGYSAGQDLTDVRDSCNRRHHGKIYMPFTGGSWPNMNLFLNVENGSLVNNFKVKVTRLLGRVSGDYGTADSLSNLNLNPIGSCAGSCGWSTVVFEDGGIVIKFIKLQKVFRVHIR